MEAQKGNTSKPSIEELIKERRKALDDQSRAGLDTDRWGLALSGGGIRSATFCFGLIRSLAARGLLHRFDLLSTVSGGGYIGALLGRLYAKSDAGQVEKNLKSADRQEFARWLRANGRYLIPRGGQDIIFAIANFARNLVGVHLQFAVLAILLGGALTGIDLVVWRWGDNVYTENQQAYQSVAPPLLSFLSRWPTPWLVVPLIVWIATIFANAYWSLPPRSKASLSMARWIVAAGAVAATWWLAWPFLPDSSRAPGEFLGQALRLSPWLLVVAVALCLSVAFGTVLAMLLNISSKRDTDEAKHKLTAFLAVAMQACAVVLALGAVDYAAWTLATVTPERHRDIAGIVVLAVVAIRAALPKIADLPRSLTPAVRIALGFGIELVGWALLLSILTFWVSLVHRASTVSVFDNINNPTGVLQFRLAWQRWAVVVIPAFALMVLTWRDRDFLNRSSLFTFYRARLVRAYLGAANPGRHFQHHTSVQDVDKGDDVPMAQYMPHLNGGPVHLINTCVNQTRDLRGRPFNQDRKGLPLTVGPGGILNVNGDGWQSPSGAAGNLTLGAWTAISGAAIAPGLGGGTRSGLAALLTLAGIRLGYWWDSSGLSVRAAGSSLKALSKYGQLLAELRGAFDGVGRRDWYLSDGGHFENTGAYALLREKCSIIVVADCGADPRYTFSDLENLVRKARIDLRAEIAFLKPRLPSDASPKGAAEDPQSQVSNGQPLPPRPGAFPPSSFGSLNDLASADSRACLALAQITYDSGERGFLIVVKPNLCDGAPVDLVNFKGDHPLFPQEPTTDQFFSEVQWESYSQLGLMLGAQLDTAFLQSIATKCDDWFDQDDGTVAVTDESGVRRRAAAPKRLPSRILSTGAVTASLSLGAFITVGTTAWQAVEARREAMDKASRVDPAIVKELSDLYGKLDSSALESDQPMLGELATAILRAGDTGCTVANARAFHDSKLLKAIVADTRGSCSAPANRAHHASCEHLLDDDFAGICLTPGTAPSCVPRYWIRDYSEKNLGFTNCVSTPRDADKPIVWALANREFDSDWARTVLSSVWRRHPVPASMPTSAASSAPPSHPASGGVVAPHPASSVTLAPSLPCAGKTVYLQIFGPEFRDSVRALRQPWQALGANVPPISDVVDLARRGGGPVQAAPTHPTVKYHDEASHVCAELLAPKGSSDDWEVSPIDSSIEAPANVIEVMMPRAAATSTMPAVGYCYQEDVKVDGTGRYGVHCHTERTTCEAVRGPNPKTIQTTCQEVPIGQFAQLLTLRGYQHSWYAKQPVPFDAPFPPLPIQQTKGADVSVAKPSQ